MAKFLLLTALTLSLTFSINGQENSSDVEAQKFDFFKQKCKKKGQFCLPRTKCCDDLTCSKLKCVDASGGSGGACLSNGACADGSECHSAGLISVCVPNYTQCLRQARSNSSGKDVGYQIKGIFRRALRKLRPKPKELEKIVMELEDITKFDPKNLPDPKNMPEFDGNALAALLCNDATIGPASIATHQAHEKMMKCVDADPAEKYDFLTKGHIFRFGTETALNQEGFSGAISGGFLLDVLKGRFGCYASVCAATKEVSTGKAIKVKVAAGVDFVPNIMDLDGMTMEYATDAFYYSTTIGLDPKIGIEVVSDKTNNAGKSQFGCKTFVAEANIVFCPNIPKTDFCDCESDCTENPSFCACTEGQKCCKKAAEKGLEFLDH